MWLFYNQDLGAGFFSLRLKIVMPIYFLQYLIKSWIQLNKHVFYQLYVTLSEQTVTHFLVATHQMRTATSENSNIQFMFPLTVSKGRLEVPRP